jgi:hypothetical protein
MHLDSLRLIVQADGDAGDSLANHATYEVAVRMRIKLGEFIKVTSLDDLSNFPRKWQFDDVFQESAQQWFEPDFDGIYVRSPNEGWWSNPKTTTRDQMLPAIFANALNGMHEENIRLFERIFSRGLFAQNTIRNGDDGPSEGRKIPDTFIGHLQWFIRPLPIVRWILWPLLLIIDCFGLLKTFFSLIPYQMKDGGRIEKRSPDNCDVRNSFLGHLLALNFAPTPISYLSRRLFTNCLHSTYGMLDCESPDHPESYNYRETNRVMGALVWYFRKEAKGNPDIAEALRPTVERYF